MLRHVFLAILICGAVVNGASAQQARKPALDEAALKARLAAVLARSPDSVAEADARLDLAKQLRERTRNAEGIEHALAAQRIYLRELGEDEPRSVDATFLVGWIYLNLGRAKEALPLLEKAVRQHEKLYGGELRTSWVRSRLALAYRAVGRVEEAEPMLLAAVKAYAAAGEKAARPYAALLGDASAFYHALGRLNEAEQYAQQSVAHYLSTFGPQWPPTLMRMRTLAEILIDQRRYQESQKILERALEFAKQHHAGTPIEGNVRSDLARVLQRLGQEDKAQVLLQEAALLLAQGGGEGGIAFASAQIRIGNSHLAQGRLEEARAAYDKAGAIYSQRGTSGGPFFLHNRGRLELASKNYPAAVDLLEKATKMFAELRGVNHPDTAAAYNVLGNAYQGQGELARALDSYRLAAGAFDNYLAQRTTQSAQARAEQEANLRTVLNRYLTLLVQHRNRTLPDGRDAADEAFAVTEQLRNRATQSAILGMSARAAVGEAELGQLVRREQDLRRERGTIEDQLAEELTSGRTGKGQGSREVLAKRTAIDRELAEIAARIAQRYPKYAQLVHPTPPKLEELRATVPPDGAILSYLVRNQSTLLWVVTRESARLHVIKVGKDELEKQVRQLRRSLDANVVTLDDLPPYDVQLAYELYQMLMAPARKELAGKRDVAVIPHGPLFSLPFAALVAAPAAAPGPVKSFAEYQRTPWVGLTHTVTVSPSAVAYMTLIKASRAVPADRPFVGFGDPTFKPLQVAAAGKSIQRSVAASREVQNLAPLPDTADEVRQIAKALGAGDSDIYLGARATELNVKKAALNRYRVVAFATHGLIAGDLEGLNEPALALTPPAKPSPEDDGLLTMSEVLALKLNADWVVLSACNTASSDGSLHGDGLSGLAQAFFYAGSRALLVTLWPVESKSAQMLTTSLFGAVRDNPKLVRTHALAAAQRSMISGKGGAPEYAHPFFWAPFILVGDGGAN